MMDEAAANAAVLCAISKQTGMSFLPTTRRRMEVDAWIASLTPQQKMKLVAVVDECHAKGHPSYDAVNDAFSFIMLPDTTELIFTVLRYRAAFSSPWKQSFGQYTPVVTYVSGMIATTETNMLDCTGEEFLRASAAMRYAHDIDNNPDLKNLNVITWTRDEAHGRQFSVYTDLTLLDFVQDHYQHVDELVHLTATRMSADLDLMREVVHHAGSRALVEGLL